ncbi:MAG: YbaN family protein [Firmicutes bacterium]|nr:YbaN family protein [Bacillota bacterium]
MDMKKIFYIIGGCISLGLGTLGAVLPLLPVVPFLLLAAICFARSSRRLHSWFLGTRLYKKNLETYVAGKGMTRQTKIRIMVTVTLLMAAGFAMMHQVAVGRIVLIGVWVFHVLYFLFGVKTIPAQE